MNITNPSLKILHWLSFALTLRTRVLKMAYQGQHDLFYLSPLPPPRLFCPICTHENKLSIVIPFVHSTLYIPLATPNITFLHLAKSYLSFKSCS